VALPFGARKKSESIISIGYNDINAKNALPLSKISNDLLPSGSSAVRNLWKIPKYRFSIFDLRRKGFLDFLFN